MDPRAIMSWGGPMVLNNMVGSYSVGFGTFFLVFVGIILTLEGLSFAFPISKFSPATLFMVFSVTYTICERPKLDA